MLDSKAIFNIKTHEEFKSFALKVFKFQFENNRVYRSFCDLLNIHPSEVTCIKDIPFLPIQFFKSHVVISSKHHVEKTFISSGTTHTKTSKHYVTDLELYRQSFERTFERFYGNIKDYVILAVLPSYLEREGSSLIYMVDHLIKQSNQPESGFYLNNLSQLKDTLLALDARNTRVLLIGVSFALLDLAEHYPLSLKHVIIMETGGMKGRRKELIRNDLHKILKNGFGVNTIHSEYGMTELLSQAYSHGDGIFTCPPWMQVLVRDPEDALTIQKNGVVGGINVIDLANINSCAFIATQDLGRVFSNGTFEIIGRFDHADIRGCNLMVL
ncbi:acyl transferase [Aestuariivivens sediminis]|uniref:LuxE/PaaK family acyltransferase n=1 Tax=Aestuariivivens sediminis TaxID=2913557 RepID=UPI001F565A2A|nr:acyl transferase [Aestuariivivens sediminis]